MSVECLRVCEVIDAVRDYAAEIRGNLRDKEGNSLPHCREYFEEGKELLEVLTLALGIANERLEKLKQKHTVKQYVKVYDNVIKINYFN